MRNASLVSSVFAAVPLTAQASWSMLYPIVAPPIRPEATLAMHETLGKAVLLWGYEAGVPATTAWVLSGNTWSLQPGIVPPYRTDAAIAFDAVRNEVVVFGGNNPGFDLRDDTWRWNGTQWTEAVVAVRPPARVNASMAFDRARGVTVLFGGLGAGNPLVPLADTWEWNGQAWQQRLPSASPPARGHATMAFDPVGGGVLLFGGIGSGLGNGTLFTDTWTWNGTAWVQRQPATPPQARVGHRMVTDLHRQRIVLLGGLSADPFAWEWSGNAWTASYQPTPAPRYLFGMGYDAAQRCVIVHGGMLTLAGAIYFFNDTWQYRTLSPADVAPFGSGCPGSTGTPELSAAPFTLPWLGDTTRHVVGSVPAGQPGAFFAAGFGAVAPVSLAPYGAPGCDLLVAIDVCEFRPAIGATVEWAKAIPLTTSLAGAWFEQQAFVVDPAANAPGVVASNAIRVTLGIR